MFNGVGVALITPFNSDLTVDYASLKTVIDNTLAGGADYLVINGTTGEASTLSDDEKNEILAFVGENYKAKTSILFGIGANDTRHVLDLIDQTNFDYVDGILTVTPYYNKPSQAGVIRHYELIADASPKPVIMYNIPGRTGINMTTATIMKLAEHKNIIGIKEASGDFGQYLEIIKSRPDGFKLISGDDMLTTSMISLGSEGVISVLSTAFPKYTELVHKALAGDYKGATELLKTFVGFNDMLYEEGNPVGIKEVLAQQGIIKNHLRLPLMHASDELSAIIKANIPA